MQINIETITELLRKEKRSPYIQDVGDDFYSRLEEYINQVHTKFPEHSKERENVEKIVMDLYGAREKKIVLNALSFARSSDEAEVDNLTPEEKKTHDRIIATLRAQRNEVLRYVLLGRKKKVKPRRGSAQAEIEHEEREITGERAKKVLMKRTVRMLEDLPPIVGVDGKTYGSFKAEDVVTLPEPNAKVFIKRGFAELIDTKG